MKSKSCFGLQGLIDTTPSISCYVEKIPYIFDSIIAAPPDISIMEEMLPLSINHLFRALWIDKMGYKRIVGYHRGNGSITRIELIRDSQASLNESFGKCAKGMVPGRVSIAGNNIPASITVLKQILCFLGTKDIGDIFTLRYETTEHLQRLQEAYMSDFGFLQTTYNFLDSLKDPSQGSGREVQLIDYVLRRFYEVPEKVSYRMLSPVQGMLDGRRVEVAPLFFIEGGWGRIKGVVATRQDGEYTDVAAYLMDTDHVVIGRAGEGYRNHAVTSAHLKDMNRTYLLESFSKRRSMSGVARAVDFAIAFYNATCRFRCFKKSRFFQDMPCHN